MKMVAPRTGRRLSIYGAASLLCALCVPSCNNSGGAAETDAGSVGGTAGASSGGAASSGLATGSSAASSSSTTAVGSTGPGDSTSGTETSDSGSTGPTLKELFANIDASGNLDERSARAFPGATGFGQHSTGGRGGRVFCVNTLEDVNEDGDGLISYREAVEGLNEAAQTPRVVTF